jgi:glycine dehydrogenase
MGADIAVGSAQRFGVPMGFGGPHAAYMATKDELKRQMPGRIVGVSKDAEGKPAIRLALQTREQHIRRDKATSNICTAQVLLAVMASMYAVYHGPVGLKDIVEKIRKMAGALKEGLLAASIRVGTEPSLDTLLISGSEKEVQDWKDRADRHQINFRIISKTQIGLTLDEATDVELLSQLYEVFTGKKPQEGLWKGLVEQVKPLPSELKRSDDFLKQSVFHSYHSEHEMLRYMTRLQSKDLSLTSSMIPLGSCTMKLNATSEMIPVTWPEFSKIHPFAPRNQTEGYQLLFKELEQMLAAVTGFSAVSLQPNAGSQGEYAGLLAIRAYQRAKGQTQRDVCLIPQSAHGTNPASAALAGMKIVVVACDSNGNVDLVDLEKKARDAGDKLSCLMITYPSTHGVFEEEIVKICKTVHDFGGQVYMDGANMNAQVGLCRPGDFGADVCHLNLHKTFCIPHGGGGPGMGPICVQKHLAPFLPNHSVVNLPHEGGVSAVSAAPWGSASILPIPYLYLKMMGPDGVTRATEVAILNANYIADKLQPHYPVLYRGKKGRVAHECIIDLRQLKATSGVEVEDVAKRLMDYGFHAPTISFPVAGTMMIEPTESESKEELDRFCEALIEIRKEIREIEEGRADRAQNVLKLAPHTAEALMRSEWTRPYSREKAAFPAGSAFLQPQFWPVIRKVAALLKDVPGEITVSGHTDNVATEDELFQSNWELSSQRAVAVAHQMIKVPGFDGNRLVVQGMADSQPLVPNNSPENRRMNRRVEIAIMQGKPTVSAPLGVSESK